MLQQGLAKAMKQSPSLDKKHNSKLLAYVIVLIMYKRILNEKKENLVGFLYVKADTTALIIVCHGFNSDMNWSHSEKICELLNKNIMFLNLTLVVMEMRKKNERSEGNREEATLQSNALDLKSVIGRIE